MIENFGLKSAGSDGTEIHLMTADDFAIWQAKASDAHQGWISAQNFTPNPVNRSILPPLMGALISPLAFLAIMLFGMALPWLPAYQKAIGNLPPHRMILTPVCWKASRLDGGLDNISFTLIEAPLRQRSIT